MSKAKKEAYAAKQKATADSRGSTLTPMSTEGPMPKTAKKATTRKQSRGK
jgi:hypothetical protein